MPPLALANPAFSVDGRLAITVDSACIFVESARGSNQFTQLTDGSEPAWTQDSTRIAVTRRASPSLDSQDSATTCSKSSDIYVVDANNPNQDFFSVREKNSSLPPASYGYANFSPDGKYLVFQSSPCTPNTANAFPGGVNINSSLDISSSSKAHKGDIWVTYIGDNDSEKCAVNLTQSISPGTNFSHPVWINQSTILISTDFYRNDNIETLTIDPNNPCSSRVVSGSLSQLGGVPLASEDNPEISPNGTFIVYQSKIFTDYDSAILLNISKCTGGNLSRCSTDDQTTIGDIGRITDLAYWTDKVR